MKVSVGKNFDSGEKIWMIMDLNTCRFIVCVQVKPLNVEHLMMDASLLLPVTATPLTGIEFSKRLACGEVEHTQRVGGH